VVQRFSVDPLNPKPESLLRAAAALDDGRILAYPTETLYGLGVDPFREDALEKLFLLKGRSDRLPVSILLRDQAMVGDVAREVSPTARHLIKAFLPGPLTLVLPAQPHLPERLTAGTGKIGIRISSHPLIRHLFACYPRPITTTSANPTGKPGAMDAGQISAYFQEGVACILDAGPVPGGRASTVVDLTGPAPVMLREGAISWNDILKAV